MQNGKGGGKWPAGGEKKYKEKNLKRGRKKEENYIKKGKRP